MATASQAKFLYFSSYAGYIAAKGNIQDGAIAFVAEVDTIYVKASSDKTHEFHIPGIADNLTTSDATKTLSAKQGVELNSLISALTSRVTQLEQSSTGDEADIAAIKAALIALAQAQAANVMSEDGTTSGLTITPGTVTHTPTPDGSILEEVTRAKIKVKIKSSEPALKVDSNGLYIDQTKIVIPESQVTGLTTDLSTMQQNIADLSTGKVDKVSGKQLSTEDFTTAYKSKLDGIESGAEVNTIEAVKVNGTALPVNSADRSVNIAINDIIDTEETIHSVNPNDPLLNLNTSRQLSSQINLLYDASAKKIKLTGKDSSVIAEIDATDFIKDGMLKNAELVVNPSGQPEGTYIKLTFNTDASVSGNVIYINVTSLIDLYYADGTTLELKSVGGKQTFSVKANVFGSYSDVETLKTTVGNASSGLVKDLNDVSTRVSQNTAAISILNGNKTQAGSVEKAVYDASTATEAKLIGTSTDTGDADTIKGAKAYAASLVSGKNVTAEGIGDDYIALTATAANNKVTVSAAATNKLSAAVALAETAVQKADISTGNTNGTIGVKAHGETTYTDVKVKGINTAAYVSEDSLKTYSVTQATEKANAVLGTASDASTANTVYGVKAYTNALFDWYVE